MCLFLFTITADKLMTEDAGTALADSSALSSRNGELVQVTLRIFCMQSTSLVPSFDTESLSSCGLG